MIQLLPLFLFVDQIWRYMYDVELRVASDQQNVILTEPPLNPPSNREKMAQVKPPFPMYVLNQKVSPARRLPHIIFRHFPAVIVLENVGK